MNNRDREAKKNREKLAPDTKRLLDAGNSIVEVSRLLNVSPNLIYRITKEYKLSRNTYTRPKVVVDNDNKDYREAASFFREKSALVSVPKLPFKVDTGPKVFSEVEPHRGIVTSKKSISEIFIEELTNVYQQTFASAASTRSRQHRD